MKGKEVNKFHLFVGFSSIIVSLLCVWWNWRLWDVKLNGNLVRTPIVETTGTLRRPDRGIYVIIDGEKLYSKGYNSSKYTLGDTVSVRYFPGVDIVVQEDMGLNFIYVESLLGLAFFLLGVVIVVYSFVGMPTKKQINRNAAVGPAKFRY